MVDQPPSFVGMIIQSAGQPRHRWRATLGSKSEDLGLEVLDGEVEVDRADDWGECWQDGKGGVRVLRRYIWL